MQELEKQLYEEGQDDEDDTQVYAPAPAADMEVSPATPPQASPMEVCHPIPPKSRHLCLAPTWFPRHSRKVPLSQLRLWMFALRVPPKPRHLCLPWR